MDLRVAETLEGHRKSHLFELIRDVTANHVAQGDGGDSGEGEIKGDKANRR